MVVWNRPDLDVDDSNIGLKGSPTRVAKSFPKSVKPAGEKVVLDGAEAAEYIVGKLKEKFVL